MAKGIVTKKILLLPIVLFFFLLILAFASAGYFFSQYKKTKEELTKIKTSPQQLVQLEAQQLVERVGQLVVLPDETPTIATVTDVELVKDRPFFAEAKNGDKVLIFTNSKKAVLYDPVNDKVVNIAPLIIGDQGQEALLTPAGPTPTATTKGPTLSLEEPTPTLAAKISFLLRNGTDRVGLTQSYEKELIEKIPNSVVVGRENAANAGYEETILVDVTGKKEKQAKELAQTLGIKLAPLPKEEEEPTDVDFLIIVGADKKGL